MNIIKLCFTILQAFMLSLTISCSNSEEPEEQTIIKKTTDKLAHDAVDRINKPIDNAKQIEELSNDRNRELTEAAKRE